MSGFDTLPENTYELTTAENNVQTNTSAENIDISEEDIDDFDTTLEKLKIRDQILRYNTSFAKYLGAYQQKIEEMDDLPLDKLKTLQKEIQISVSARTSGNLAKNNYIALISSVEYVAPIIGMNLRGLSTVLSQSQEISETIEELNIKYDIMNYVSPEVRLLFLTSNMILAVNRENQKMQKIINIMEEPVTNDHVNEFQDL